MLSSDKREWDRKSRLPLWDLAVVPADPDRIVGTGEEGTIVSADGGRTWSPLAGEPELVVLGWDDCREGRE